MQSNPLLQTNFNTYNKKKQDFAVEKCRKNTKKASRDLKYEEKTVDVDRALCYSQQAR